MFLQCDFTLWENKPLYEIYGPPASPVPYNSTNPLWDL